ncbi:MAG: bifunctional tetrahydrofolate synthase/dihydrofolate synthase [Gammaproteobacteria bacterium]|nr:bifunctional tetrahydrofolate synthase/dihydrofolate synthase [Gammaproteobacteria bacterium]
MRFKTLPEWLAWQENLHFTEVDPGLSRIGLVWNQLRKEKTVLPFTVITVAGTNGKGSSVAMLESILRSAGYRTGTYTSPHLLRYNERICINSIPCDDTSICQAFERIDKARQATSLTYFEFATLAAIDIFCQQKIDIAILEVGMGGRLDAVNLFDTDIALITPIGLDHVNWLGSTRELIGREKAGIIRANKPVVCSESEPPQSLLAYAQSLSAPVYKAQTDYHFSVSDINWQWSRSGQRWQDLPFPALAGSYQFNNAAAVLKVIDILIKQGKDISKQAIARGLSGVKLAGRFQQISGPVERIFDVTHNQQGAENLAKLLAEKPCDGKTYAVLAMLKDKDVAAVVDVLKSLIDVWYLAGLSGSRGMTADEMANKISHLIEPAKCINSAEVIDAYHLAMENAENGDRVLIFGSFHTVEAVMKTILND